MLFDRYIMVDWSSKDGLSTVAPEKDAVWMAVAGESGDIKETYFRSRAACVQAVLEELGRSGGSRVLVGFDFPYGYPSGFAAALGHSGAPAWRWIWDQLASRVQDQANNENNRFGVAAAFNKILTRPQSPWGPFWARPATPALEELTENCPYKAPFETVSGVRLQAHRLTELPLPRAQSVWKLYTAGSVGGQALVGIPCVAKLRDAQATQAKVWPFETGFTASPLAEGATVLHAEIWPGVIDGQFPLLVASRERDRLRSRLKKKKRDLTVEEANAIRERLTELEAELGPLITDQLQVRFMCEWARTQDSQGALAQRFGAPPKLTEDQLDKCVREEGWILGAH